MSSKRDRWWAVQYAMRFIGAPGYWGGNGPWFDCSGFAQEPLRAAGVYDRKVDRTAHELWEHYADCRVDLPQAGCLVFWWSQSRPNVIGHVGICIGNDQYIGAEGTRPGIDTGAEAAQAGALVCVRFLDSRGEPAGYADPFLKT